MAKKLLRDKRSELYKLVGEDVIERRADMREPARQRNELHARIMANVSVEWKGGGSEAVSIDDGSQDGAPVRPGPSSEGQD